MTAVPSGGKALTIATFDRALVNGCTACDLRRMTFIDAYGVVGTACAIRAAGLDPDDIELPAQQQVRDHLRAMGFDAFLRGAVESRVEDEIYPDVVVPLHSTSDSVGAQALSNLLWSRLAAHVDPGVLSALAEGVWEMVANATEHSGRDAVVMGQVYRAPRGRQPDHDDRVQVVIGDIGRGIRQSFLGSGKHAPATDEEAIATALEYLASSVDDPGRGQGLFTTMEQVVGLRGRMVVRSGEARVSITAEGRTIEQVPLLPGVIVALSLPLYP